MAPLSVQAHVSSEAIEDGTVVVSVDGDVNVANAPEVGSHLLDILGWPRSEVVVDLRGVTWIDPGVLGTVVLALRQAEARQHTLVLVRPGAGVWRTFETAGLAGALSNCGDVDEALCKLHEPVARRFERSPDTRTARRVVDVDPGWRPVTTPARRAAPNGGHDDGVSCAQAVVSLTTRERRVLGELARGRTTEDAASAIGVSAHTVRSHLKSASRKLGAQTRTHAVALAIAQGSIPVSSICAGQAE